MLSVSEEWTGVGSTLLLGLLLFYYYFSDYLAGSSYNFVSRIIAFLFFSDYLLQFALRIFRREKKKIIRFDPSASEKR